MVPWKKDCLTKPQPWRLLITPRDTALKRGGQEEEILLPLSLTVLLFRHWPNSKGKSATKRARGVVRQGQAPGAQSRADNGLGEQEEKC